MTPGEALLSVQAALNARGLPGDSCGLLEQSRTFIVCLRPADSWAADPVADVLEAMGCEVSVNGSVFGKVTGKLLPAPELPPAEVRSANSSSVAEGAALTEAPADKLCRGPCGQVKPLDSFSLNSTSPQGKRRRMHFCRPCDAARQKRARGATVS
jgi:hypothetical protein